MENLNIEALSSEEKENMIQEIKVEFEGRRKAIESKRVASPNGNFEEDEGKQREWEFNALAKLYLLRSAGVEKK